MSQFHQACCPPVKTAPIAVAPVCPSVLGASTGIILVLFILLVIILRTFCF
ncbi:hypothetical protein [Paenibacillus sp. IHBB 10380]|uniref:hypothetical protein n=1 Tax=Paenibacillus sp. IHBB 10380 TaxID=1566358 RepID=UPI0013648F44|nr:hypothetical protein [Paenibacillus sp. IHBB 10380]